FTSGPLPVRSSCASGSCLATCKMVIYYLQMDISITKFKHRCLEIVRRVEKTGKPVTIRRHGKAVAQLKPTSGAIHASQMKPWEQLRALGGNLQAEPEDYVVHDEAFEAMR